MGMRKRILIIFAVLLLGLPSFALAVSIDLIGWDGGTAIFNGTNLTVTGAPIEYVQGTGTPLNPGVGYTVPWFLDVNFNAVDRTGTIEIYSLENNPGRITWLSGQFTDGIVIGINGLLNLEGHGTDWKHEELVALFFDVPPDFWEFTVFQLSFGLDSNGYYVPVYSFISNEPGYAAVPEPSTLLLLGGGLLGIVVIGRKRAK